MKTWYEFSAHRIFRGEIKLRDGVLPENAVDFPPPSQPSTGKEWQLGIDLVWREVDQNQFTRSTVIASPPKPLPPKQWDSTLAFLREFTRQERISIRSAAKNDPVIEDFMDLLEKSPTVHADDEDVIAGMQYLDDQGYITTERHNEIMQNT